MRCAWAELIAILPQWMRTQVDQIGRERLLELRLRCDHRPELVCLGGNTFLERVIGSDDLNFIVNAASQYSPWSASTAAHGYITASGGHRIGMCGDAIIGNQGMSGIRSLSSLCIRVARDFDTIAMPFGRLKGSILIIGKPGSGKTTLLRDLIRIRSKGCKESIGVVDERGEIFPRCGSFETGPRTDVLRGCSKKDGIEILLRTMGPGAIAVDEITSEKDCEALVRAGWCGVDLLATAHAASKKDLHTRPVYQQLLHKGLFEHLVVVHMDKSCTLERMEL